MFTKHAKISQVNQFGYSMPMPGGPPWYERHGYAAQQIVFMGSSQSKDWFKKLAADWSIFTAI